MYSKFLKNIALGLAVLFTFAACAPAEIPPKNIVDEQPTAAGIVFLLDTVIEQKWYGPGAQQTYDDVVAYLTEMDEKISSYNSSSEVSLLSAVAGQSAVQLSDEVYELLERSQQYAADSGGVFDVTVAPLAKLWDVQNRTVKPAPEEVAAALALVDANKLVLYPQNKSAMLLEVGMEVDLGSVAKGWLTEKVAEIAAENGVQNGYISLGGNMYVIGEKPNGSDFVFGIRNPRGTPADYIGTLTLRGMTMSTSGDYERYFIENGVRYHHIFDIASGYPANGGIISVTVISPNGMFADYFSTKVFTKGLEYALENLNGENYALVVVDDNLNVYISDSLKNNFIFNENAEGFTFKS